jgi:hypothetical protein
MVQVGHLIQQVLQQQDNIYKAGTGLTQTAALAVGGVIAAGPTTTATEEWNIGVYSYSAAAWASGGNLNTARGGIMGVGTQTATVAFSVVTIQQQDQQKNIMERLGLLIQQHL